MLFERVPLCTGSLHRVALVPALVQQCFFRVLCSVPHTTEVGVGWSVVTNPLLLGDLFGQHGSNFIGNENEQTDFLNFGVSPAIRFD